MFGGDMKIKYKIDKNKALLQINRPLWTNRTVYFELKRNIYSKAIFHNACFFIKNYEL